ncbi:MAG: MATE family efflux transporter [Cohaesibacteraceae bacterium]|nr:MATE family efflux transporter [Cohaesibacteraceae bacterium]
MSTASAAPESRAFHVNNRSVLVIAIPMMLAYLSTPLLGIVDTAVIGQLGNPALIGGVAVGAILFDIIFTSLNFLRSGTTGLVAQAMGSNNNIEKRAIFMRAMLLAIFAGLISILVAGPLLAAGLYFMAPSEAVTSAVKEYYFIRIIAAPFALANYIVLGWFLGLGRAKMGLLLQTLLNGTNIILNITFVIAFDMGISGVAWGTVCGEVLTAIVGVVLVLRALKAVPKLPAGMLFNWQKLKHMFALNRDIMIRSFVLLIAFMFFTAQGTRDGDVILAANAVLMNFFMIAGFSLDGFATAAEQLVGRAVGARYRPAFFRTFWLTLAWGYGVAVLLTLFLILVQTPFIALMTTSLDVRTQAAEYAIWAANTPLTGMLAFHLDGVFIGATWSKDMRNMMLLSLAMYLAFFFALEPVYGNHGLWMAFNLFLAIRGIALMVMVPSRARQSFG